MKILDGAQRSRLNGIAEWLEPLELENLGLSSEEAAIINDDRFGRVVD